MMAPCGPVTFWHVIVADYLTSMAKAGQDLQLTACISAHIYTADHQGHAGHMSSTALWEEERPDTSSPLMRLVLALTRVWSNF
jgi:hypothetical protein|tara:strand:- start:3080 stop:3328 length:249 start_codon:yes stop_codon:yes gene_type:complete